MLVINRIIVHELEKEATKTSAKLNLFDSLVDEKDTRILHLVDELNNRYRENNQKYGVFNDEDPSDFHNEFKTYYERDSNKSFISFTKESSRSLKDRIENIAAAKGGFLVFVDYKIHDRFFAVFLVRNTEGISFRISSNQFDIDDVQHIDVENLAMACRINLNLFENDELRYLSFINNKSDSVSKFFLQWISSKDLETNKQDTENLYQLLKLVPLPIDQKTGESEDRSTFLNRAHSIIINTFERKVNLVSLSKALFDDENILSNQCEKNNTRINSVFTANRSVLRKFVHVKVKADRIELGFPLELYKNYVRIDENDPNQIIINSEKLAAKIKQSIEENE